MFDYGSDHVHQTAYSIYPRVRAFGRFHDFPLHPGAGKEERQYRGWRGFCHGDIIGGYAFWAPWTLVIKFLMAFLMGAFVEHMEKKGRNNTGSFGISAMEIVGMVIAGIEMVVGYYIASAVMYGNLLVPVPSIPWNVGQFAVGMVIASIIASALCKTPAKKYFAIK